MSTQAIVPGRIEDLSTEWLSDVLSDTSRSVNVSRIRTSQVIHGTTTGVRLAVDYASGGADLPASFWVKAGFEPHSGRIAQFAVRECQFYERHADELPVNRPTCFASVVDHDTGHPLLLLEDLQARSAEPGDPTTPMTLETAQMAVEMLAELHATRWNAASLTQLGPFGGSVANATTFNHYLSPEIVERSLDYPRAEFVPAFMRDVDLMRRCFEQMWDLNRSMPPCFLHGDPHLGNMFFDADGTPGLLDWQIFMQGPGVHDVTEMLITGMSISDRRTHDRHLIQVYLDALIARGIEAPSFAETWALYRCNALYGYVWATCPPQQQTEEVCLAVAERYITAMEDLETVSLLR